MPQINETASTAMRQDKGLAGVAAGLLPAGLRSAYIW